MSERLVEVALPLPVQSAFTYRMPDREPIPERSCRVVVPFRSRRVVGVVTGAAAGAPGAALKDVLEVLDEAPLVAPPLLDLAAWIADHYLAPPGECYRLILPQAGMRASRSIVRLAGGSAPEDDPVVEALRHGPLRVSTLARRLGKDPASRLQRLRRSGAVVVEQDLSAPGFRHVRIAVLAGADAAPRGRAQAEVLDRLRQAGGRQRVPDLLRNRPALR